jgi:hypothetical protein
MNQNLNFLKTLLELNANDIPPNVKKFVLDNFLHAK